MQVFSRSETGRDGLPYSVRYLLTREELAGLQAAGLVGEVDEVVSLQDVAAGVIASMERDLLVARGGVVQ